MMYGYMTLPDETGIAHSEMKPDGSVKVCFEKPVNGGFYSATCHLPDYRWENVCGFSENDVCYLQKILQDNARLIQSGESSSLSLSEPLRLASLGTSPERGGKRVTV